jgi:hypothetical protein
VLSNRAILILSTCAHVRHVHTLHPTDTEWCARFGTDAVLIVGFKVVHTVELTQNGVQFMGRCGKHTQGDVHALKHTRTHTHAHTYLHVADPCNEQVQNRP